MTPEEQHITRLNILKKLEAEIAERHQHDKENAEKKHAEEILGYDSNGNAPVDENQVDSEGELYSIYSSNFF